MLTWQGDDFTINGIEYVCRPLGQGFASEPGRFFLMKNRAAVESFEHLVATLKPRNLLEIGMWHGASLALLTDLAGLTDPAGLTDLAGVRRAVGVDRRPALGRAFLDFVERRGLADVVHTYTGVDQTDRTRLDEIVAVEFDEPLDLIIDDASHLLDATRTTFGILFPRLRPGGKYVIEDWNWAHGPLPIQPDKPSLSVLSLELVLAAACWPQAIAGVEVTDDWTLVTRGRAALPAPFDFRIGIDERGRDLLPANGDTARNANADVTMSNLPFAELEQAWLADEDIVAAAHTNRLDVFLGVFAPTLLDAVRAHAEPDASGVARRVACDADFRETLIELYGTRVYRRALAES